MLPIRVCRDTQGIQENLKSLCVYAYCMSLCVLFFFFFICLQHKYVSNSQGSKEIIFCIDVVVVVFSLVVLQYLLFQLFFLLLHLLQYFSLSLEVNFFGYTTTVVAVSIFISLAVVIVVVVCLFFPATLQLFSNKVLVIVSIFRMLLKKTKKKRKKNFFKEFVFSSQKQIKLEIF